MKTAVTIEIDTDGLQNLEDVFLAQLWHVAQANPASGYEGPEAGELAESIGREIIRRWLARAPVELYRHKGDSYYWDTLRRHGTWINGEWVPANRGSV